MNLCDVVQCADVVMENAMQLGDLRCRTDQAIWTECKCAKLQIRSDLHISNISFFFIPNRSTVFLHSISFLELGFCCFAGNRRIWSSDLED